METLFNKCIHQNSLDKTIRNRLKPVYGFAKGYPIYLANNAQLEQQLSDFLVNDLAFEEFVQKELKPCIKDIHKEISQHKLSEFNFELNDLQTLKELSDKKDKEKKDYDALRKWQENLRKKIAKAIKPSNDFFSKNIVNSIKDERLVKKVEGKFTYLNDFFENMKNIYSTEEESTAIAYRTLHDNFSIFTANQTIASKLRKELEESKAQSLEKTKLQNKLSNELLSNLGAFNQCLTQEPLGEKKGIEGYNIFIGRSKTDESNQGCNELINKCYQDKILKNRLTFKKLKNQILCRPGSSDIEINTFTELQQNLNGLISHKSDIAEQINKVLRGIEEKLKADEYDRLWIANRKSLNTLSQLLFNSWDELQNALYNKWNLSEEDEQKFSNKFPISWQEINEALQSQDKSINLTNFFDSFIDQLQKINNDFITLEDWLNDNEDKEKLDKSESSKDTEVIKNLLDGIKAIDRDLLGIFNVDFDKVLKKYNQADKSEIHTLIEEWRDLLNGDSEEICFNHLYNQVRNFVTQKPYSLSKQRIIFGKGTLMDGWDYGKKNNLQYGALWFRKGKNFFLGVIPNKSASALKTIIDSGQNLSPNHPNLIEAFHYQQDKNIIGLAYRKFLPKNNIDKYHPSDTVKCIIAERPVNKRNEYFDGLAIKDREEVIAFFKNCIEKNWKNYQFEEANEYRTISEFYNDIQAQSNAYSFNPYPISEDILNQLISEQKLFLFQVWNKDFAPKSTGRENLHTSYFKALFDETNLTQNPVIFKMDGRVKVFWRKASLKESETTIHRANEPIKNKLNSSSAKFGHNIIKDKRFTENQYFLHLPITINFGRAFAKGGSVNHTINSIIKNDHHQQIKVLGLDRGENHLIYASLINQKGEIEFKKSFNCVGHNNHNYQQKLHQRENERNEARKEWQTIENIKELKQGYLSQVVHEIAKLVVDRNAIVVMEDLNAGFKNSRKKIEKEVYQKFERALIDKLQYLVFKDRQPDELGGLYCGYQLTMPFAGFNKLGKQSGILFYINPQYTSVTDPASGFFKCLHFKSKKEEIIKALREAQAKLSYDKAQDCFTFTFAHRVFERSKEVYNRQWELNSKVERFVRKKENNFKPAKTDLTQELKILLTKYEVDLQGDDLLQLKAGVNQPQVFYQGLKWFLSLWQELRHKVPSGKQDEEGKEIYDDHIISPVAPYFNSSKAQENQPQDGDANGAYNIARKGLIVMQKIKEGEKGLKVSQLDWLNYLKSFERD